MEETVWKLRGLYSQVNAVQQSVVEAIAAGEFRSGRRRDLIGALEFLIEQIREFDAHA